MDKALQAAVVSMATRQCDFNSKMEEEKGEKQEEGGDGHMRWLHAFVALALPESRHQVTIRTEHISADTKRKEPHICDITHSFSEHLAFQSGAWLTSSTEREVFDTSSCLLVCIWLL